MNQVSYSIKTTMVKVQWLRLCTFNTGGTNPIPSGRTKIPYAAQCRKEKQNRKLWLAMKHCKLNISKLEAKEKTEARELPWCRDLERIDVWGI